MTDIPMTGGDSRAMDWFPGTPSNLPWYFRRSTRSSDVAVLPGEAATADAIGREKERDALVELVQKFAVYGLSWNAERAVKISWATTNAAIAFFLALPARAALPRISPDGEGGLLMAWETRDDLVIAVLDGRCIHLVASATTPRARYHDDLPFDGGQIPTEILESIPAR